jgi:hypothetical protein
MQQPNVRSTLNDPNTGVTYHVMAYRPLTRGELIQSVRAYLSQKKVKKSKLGAVITILTIIGYDE